MTQREDLEYAAKAAGMPKGSVVGSGDYLYERDGIVIYWNPLDNKADSFSLMCALKSVEIDIAHNYSVVRHFSGVKYIGRSNDPEAATRLAIFRAAVAAGRAMG